MSPDRTPIFDAADLLARLVGFDTVSDNSNLDLIDFVADYLDRPGIHVERNTSEDGRKANLIVTVGPGGDDTRTGLVLSGHTDVVPADEPEWESDPFTLLERDGALYGRGACDMKGFVALAVQAAATLEPSKLENPLVLVLTYDEEMGLLGAKRFAETWPDLNVMPRNAWIGEPTKLEVVRAHTGFIDLAIRFAGVSAHSGYPHLGRSAIEPAGSAIQALAQLRRELEAERPDSAHEFPDVPFVALNVGTVSGGSAINVVPDQCTLKLCVRPLPGVDASDLVERVRSAVEGAVPGAEYSLEVASVSPPMSVSRDAAIYRALLEEVGQDAERTVSYGTDGGWLQTAGFDCVIFGPGDIAVAHKPNEYLPIGEFARARDILETVIQKFCH